MFVYAPPSNWNDFAPPNYQNLQSTFQNKWHSFILGQFTTNITQLKSSLGATPLFFTEAQQAIPDSVAAIPISWNGFPRCLALKYTDPAQLFAAADTLEALGSTGLLERPQDEYLEWYAVKDKSGAVKKFVFTAEGREYWSRLADVSPDRVVDLYQQLLDDTTIKYDALRVVRGFRLSSDEVYARGDYNPWNDFNTKNGCVHLTHHANSLGAEINLAAVATVQKTDASGNRVSEPHRLACCSSFGVADRSSDPTIGQAVNLSVRGGVSATLANPVGLYIGSIDLSTVTGPDGQPVNDWWKITRGSDGKGLRAEFGPPAGAKFSLDKITVGSDKLARGGQLAQLITMVLFARVYSLGLAEPTATSCENRCCVASSVTNPDNALLDQIAAGDPTPPGERDAYPELTMPGHLQARLTRRGGTANAEHIE